MYPIATKTITYKLTDIIITNQQLTKGYRPNYQTSHNNYTITTIQKSNAIPINPRTNIKFPTIHIILYQPLRFQKYLRKLFLALNLNGVSCISMSENGERPYQHPLNIFLKPPIMSKIYQIK